jgi:DNA-binding XRE family transcriptional regulator
MQTNVHAATDPALAEIKAGMARFGLTQADLAAALNLSRAAVHRRLTGRVDFSLGELRITAKLVHQPLAHIVDAPALAEGGDVA